mgnify:CR=1 FL=1
METQNPVNEAPYWTWADQLSSYRFWGLLLFYSLSGIAVNTLMLGAAQVSMMRDLGMSVSSIGLLGAFRTLGSLYGFYLAWIAARWRTIPMLGLCAFVELAGIVLALLPGPAAPLALRFAGAVLIGIGWGALSLAIPAILAGGRGGSEALVITFGIMSMVYTLGSLQISSLTEFLVKSGISPLLFVGVPLVVGVCFLFGVPSTLFATPPSAREETFPPTYRNPVVVALLFLIPFYWLHWTYRVHGEVAALAPSRTLLSPWTVVLEIFFLPFLFPIAMTTLIEALNRQALAHSAASWRPAWHVGVWSFFLPPVGALLVQLALNGAMNWNPTEEME